jgi:biopolymer transport protein ExbD
MKRFIILSAFLVTSVITHAQIKYTVDKVSNGTVKSNGQINSGPFKQLSKRFIAYLYNDAMVFDEGFDGLGDTYYKFARKIDLPDKQMFNATDRNGQACVITIKDFENYTLIAVKYMNSNQVTIYQTL